MATTTIAQPGLEWNNEISWYDPDPRWTIEPDVTIISQVVQRELSLPKMHDTKSNYMPRVLSTKSTP